MSAAAWILLTGILTGVACGLVGSFLVLRRMAMLGDAISHAVLPGIAVAFLLTRARQSLTMLVGAALVGLLTVFLVDVLHRKGRLQRDASIGVTFTFLFALGVILISLFGRYVDLDQDCVLFGEIAFVPWDSWIIGELDLGPRAVWSLGAALLANAIFILLFFKELKLISFDPVLARSMGVPVTAVHYGLMGCVALTTVAAFESVGAILVVAMLVVPAAAAYLFSERLWAMIALSSLLGGLSALLGFFSAAALDVSISGMMAVAAGILFAAAFVYHVIHKQTRARRITEPMIE